MKKKTPYSPLLILLFTCNFLFAQPNNKPLEKNSYDYLQKQIEKNEGDSIQKLKYLNAFLSKAKEEGNTEQLFTAYENFVYNVSEAKSVIYADSMVNTAQRIGSPEKIGSAYLSKGIIYYSLDRYNAALDNFITANNYLTKTNNENLKHLSRFSIANIKFYLGFYDEALLLYKECAEYYKEDDIDGYLSSLHAISLCYNKMQEYDLCSATNAEGVAITKKTSGSNRYYFIHSEGVNQHSRKNYVKSINYLNEALPSIVKNDDFSNESIAYFYLGKNYMALGQIEKALPYFKKVDKIFSEKNYISPDLRENFEILINYYKEQEDTRLQLHYINKLIKADKILNENFKYLSGKIHKEYDTRQLLDAKKEIEIQLASKQNTAIILYAAIAILFISILFLLYRYYKNQQLYRKNFEELMQRTAEPATEIITTPEEITANKKIDINPDVVASILKQLEKFETKKKFLQKDLTLVNLASAFGTNTNYLSKVISISREKNYINYLNDLRIDYIVNLLKEEPRYRNYTMKALADEAGFNTAQHFSKAFFAKTGIYPSYFVNELNKELKVAV
jgi:AraC-like DNA-binding protein